MLFNSMVFVVFALLFYFIWPFFRKSNVPRWSIIVIASFIFYGWWDVRFLVLLVFTGLIDYWAGLAIFAYPKYKKPFLILSLIGNLGSLAIFKYLDFGIANANALMNWMGYDIAIPYQKLILPVGISFYTFQSMSYTIDVYKDQLKPTKNVLHFFAYLSMFPQLVAGPIVRAADLLPQLEEGKPASDVQLWDGLRLIAYGYVKKVVIADQFAPVINDAFSAAVPLHSCIYWWIVMVLFAFQIYCDFSGYSDIARGLAKWMGYEFPLNFDHPYIATSFKNFWQRWHISLSTWFRDYVYIPLGGSRVTKSRAIFNLWITMVVSGFWHGAAWPFVVWGVLHGTYMVIERLTNWNKHFEKNIITKFMGMSIVFTLVLIAWVFFRASTMQQAISIISEMFNFSHLSMLNLSGLIPLHVMLLLFLIALRQLYIAVNLGESGIWPKMAMPYFETVTIIFLLVFAVFCRGTGSAFIYFQF